MTIARGFHGFGESHLMPDAIVAYADGELSPTATRRAAAHLSRCACCAAEVDAQRQARTQVRSSEGPAMPAGLLAALRDIPNDADVPAAPDGLAMTREGQLVAVQRPERAAAPTTDNLTADTPLGTAPLGSSPPLGTAHRGLGGRRGHSRSGRRAAQGAGALVSGLMLGALALSTPPGSAQPGTAFGGADRGRTLPASLGGTAAARTAVDANAHNAGARGAAHKPQPVSAARAVRSLPGAHLGR